MLAIVTVLFWLCGALVIYVYLGYPLLIWALARWLGRSPQPPAASEELPTVTLLIAAHNEEADIEKRIRSALRMDYPAERLEILIASDGSTDATPHIVRCFSRYGVRLLDYPERRGKAAVLNAAMPEANGDIVLLSDANTDIDRQALRRLVRWFRDPQIGVVCGRLILHDPTTGRNVDGLYWQYETFLKKNENRLGALLGANGAIYALRRRLFQPIPDGTIVDDLVIPLLAKLRSGCGIVYECEALAHEETPRGLRCEFRRRSRIGAGGFQSLGLLWRLLHPRHGWTAFSFLSHKVLRWLCPFFLIGLLVCNLALLGQPFYRTLLLGQLAFYSLAVAAAFVPTRMRLLKPLRLATMFLGMNTALLCGCWCWLRGKQNGIWKPTPRLAQL